MDSSQQQLADAYGVLLNKLQEYSNRINSIKGVNEDFVSIQNCFIDRIDSKIAEATTQLQNSLEDTVWDNLVIAFFGETNAGKSTIIETFRILFDETRQKEDGLIVGDGRQDFTKVYAEYHLSINGHPFTLIDVPGIEGNEMEYKEGIKNALHKAHCVFYVQGHNKKPDVATAEKIKHYLGDWVRVYSIYNVRGGADQYDEAEERETLFTPSVKKNEILIKDTFQEILGDIYAGNMTIQALLAMSAKAVFSNQREDLKKKQTKLLQYFANAGEILRFSQFQTVINLIEEKSRNFTLEIIEANKQKMISLINKVISEINLEISAQSNNIDRLSSLLRSFNEDSIRIIADGKSALNRKTKGEVEKQLNNLKSSIFGIIDNNNLNNERKKSEVQREQNRVSNAIQIGLTSIIESELSRIKENLKNKRKSLDELHLGGISFPSYSKFSSNINFNGAIDELDFSFDDFATGVEKTGGIAAAGAGIGTIICPGLGTVIGGIIGGIGGFIVSLFTSRDRNGEAKSEVSKAIEAEKRRTISDLETALLPIMDKLDSLSNNIKSNVRIELNNIASLKNNLGFVKNDLNELILRINNTNYGTI